MGVFVDTKRSSPEVKVQKSRTFKQNNFLKGFAKKNSQEDSQKTAELGFCNSQQIDFGPEPDEEQNEISICGSEDSKDKTISSLSASVGVSMRSSQQAIFKQKLQTYEGLTPELKVLASPVTS